MKKSIAVTAFLSCTFSALASSATIEYLPSGSSNAVAANVPQSNNIWSSVAQSFRTVDERVTAGFYMLSDSGLSPVRYNLYSGDGLNGPLLASVWAIVPEDSTNLGLLVEADFSHVHLTVGSVYTIQAELPSAGLPPVGEYSASRIVYAGLDNPYADGRFYFGGSAYDMSNPAFADRDIAFRVSGVPIPAAAWLFGSALLGLAAVKRKKA